MCTRIGLVFVAFIGLYSHRLSTSSTSLCFDSSEDENSKITLTCSNNGNTNSTSVVINLGNVEEKSNVLAYGIRYKKCSSGYKYQFVTDSQFNVPNLDLNACYEFSATTIKINENQIYGSRKWTIPTEYKTGVQRIKKRCPKYFIEIDGWDKSCLLFSNVHSTQLEAKNACKQYGAHLAVVDSSKKNSALKDYLKKTMDPPVKSSWWIDGTDEGHEGKWVFESTGSPISFADWGTSVGEPTKSTSENCLLLWYYGSLQWGDYGCNYKGGFHISFVCEVGS